MKSYMKILWVMLFSMLTLSLTACGDDDEPDNPSSTADIVGTWKGYADGYKPNDDMMTAKFYEDGTCDIWWYQNKEITTYHLGGTYTITKKKLRITGSYGDNGYTPYMDYDKEVSYSLKDGTLKFKFDLLNWILTKQ